MADAEGARIPLAEMFRNHRAAFDVRTAEAARFEAEQNELRKLNQGASSQFCPSSEEIGNWEKLARVPRDARIALLLNHRVFGVRKGINEIPFEIPASIKRTMVIFDLERGAMSDADGVRQFECVEFFIPRSETALASPQSENIACDGVSAEKDIYRDVGGRPKKNFPWDASFDLFLLDVGRRGAPPSKNEAIERFLECMMTADPDSDEPGETTVRREFNLRYPKFFNAIKLER